MPITYMGGGMPWLKDDRANYYSATYKILKRLFSITVKYLEDSKLLIMLHILYT